MSISELPPVAVRPTPPRVPAIDCLQRGMASAWANRELVLVAWVQTLVVTVLVVVSVLVPFAAIGFELAAGLGDDPEAMLENMPAVVEGLTAAPMRLGLAVLAASVLLGVAMWAYCWFQAGIFGILTAAERQAPRGSRAEAVTFRTFSVRNLAGWAGRWSWRYFGFYHVAMGLAFVPLLATLVLIAAIALASERWGGGAAFGVGCGGMLPVGFLYVVLGLWMAVAQAELADATSSVVSATRRGFEILGRRLGATLLLFVLFVTAASAVATASLSLSFTASLFAADDLMASLFVNVLVTLAEAAAMSALGVVFAASMVALVRSEMARGGEGLG